MYTTSRRLLDKHVGRSRYMIDYVALGPVRADRWCCQCHCGLENEARNKPISPLKPDFHALYSCEDGNFVAVIFI